MGGGASEQYESTVGANPSYFRPPFSEISSSLRDEHTIEAYSTGMIKGFGLGGSTKKKRTKSYIKPENVLMMIDNYKADTMSKTDFINWVDIICTDPAFDMDFDLRVLLLKILDQLKRAETQESFEDILDNLEIKLKQWEK